MPAVLRPLPALILFFCGLPTSAQDTPRQPDNTAAVQSALRDVKTELDANREALAALKADIAKLREENTALRLQVQSLDQLRGDLTNQLAGQALVLAALREDIRAILETVRVLAPRRAPIETANAPVPQDPLASPASLLTALRERYERDIHTLARPKDMSDDAFLGKRREFLEKWCTNMARAFRGKTRWLVRIDSDPPIDGRIRAGRMTVLDPLTRQAIGDSFAVEVPNRFSDVLAAANGSGLYELDLTLTAAPKFDATLASPTVFNYPPQVGPFVRFGMETEWQVLAPVRGSDRGNDPKQDR